MLMQHGNMLKHTHKGTEGAQVCSIYAATSVLPVWADAAVPSLMKTLKAHMTCWCDENKARAKRGKKARE